MDALYRARLVAFFLTAASASWGCSRDNAPPPIPDPGGPFHTNVAPDKSLGALTQGELSELCAEISNAQETFLFSFLVENNCRSFAVAFTDAGATFLNDCQTEYDKCKRDSDPTDLFNCPFPAPNCNAPVELVSACLNEIAATDPSTTCLDRPTCAQAATAADPRTFDAGVRDLSQLPPFPACVRLATECESAVFFYPCD